MELHVRLVHVEAGLRVVEVRACRGEQSLGSALAEAPTAQEAEDLATARLLQRLAAGDLAPVAGGTEPGSPAGPDRAKALLKSLRLESPPPDDAAGASATGAAAADTWRAVGRPGAEGSVDGEPTTLGVPSAHASPTATTKTDAQPHRSELLKTSRAPDQTGLPLQAPHPLHAPLTAASAAAADPGDGDAAGRSGPAGPSALTPPLETCKPPSEAALAGPEPDEAGSVGLEHDPQEEPPADPEDWSQELTGVDLQLRRLGWSREQEGLYLQRAFGHPSRSRLTRYSDLRAYLTALEGLERGSDPAVAAVPLRRSELLAQGDALLTQLGWSAEQGRAFLERELNRISRQQLSDMQLLQFNMLLEGELLTREAPAPLAAADGSQR